MIPGEAPQPKIISALIATHRFLDWTGSEMVAIDLWDDLRAAGVDCTLYCPFIEFDFAQEALGENARIITAAEDVHLADFDLAYVQHQMLSRVLHLQKNGVLFRGPRPYIVFAHLSPYEPFEFPGPFCEVDVADEIWVNSEETCKKIKNFGSKYDAVSVVPNPAPKRFEHIQGKGTQLCVPKRLLSVSNHLPQELVEAFDLLARDGIEVTRLGRPDGTRRLTPDDIEGHDAVVTIGKTVQNALRARRAVYNYDMFSGPGWLLAENFELSRLVNFSGRNHSELRTAEKIAAEIKGGFGSAQLFVETLPEHTLDQFRLEHHTMRLLNNVLLHLADPMPIRGLKKYDSAQLSLRWGHEAAFYNLVDREYGQKLRAQAHNKKLNKALTRLRETNKL